MIFEREDISEKIYQISILQQQFVAAQLKNINLNQIQARTLTFISQNPGTMQRDLAAYLGKQQATVTNVLKGLEQAGFVKREIPKDNERQKNLYLTVAGQSLVRQVKTIFDELNEAVKASLTQADQQTVLNQLDQILQNFKPK